MLMETIGKQSNGSEEKRLAQSEKGNRIVNYVYNKQSKTIKNAVMKAR